MALQTVHLSRLAPDSKFPVGFTSFTVDELPPDAGLWAPLEGQAVSRTGDYAALFARWGTRFGAGDGSTTFNVKDMRGYFPRGWDNGRGVDAARTIGSDQTDMVKAHNHPLTMNPVGDHAHATNALASRGANGSGNRGWSSGDSVDGSANLGTSSAGGHTPSGTIGNNTGAETRPLNSSVRFWVKL